MTPLLTWKNNTTLSTVAHIQGWTLANYREHVRIRQELKEKCKEASREAWENKLLEIIDSTKDTKCFWKKVNRLRGKDITHCNYLTDDQGNKYFTDKEKCQVMAKPRKNVFTITPQENEAFYARHFEHISTYINIQQHRVTPYNRVDFNRLNNNFYT